MVDEAMVDAVIDGVQAVAEHVIRRTNSDAATASARAARTALLSRLASLRAEAATERDRRILAQLALEDIEMRMTSGDPRWSREGVVQCLNRKAGATTACGECHACGAAAYVGELRGEVDALRARAERAEACNEAMRAPMRVLREYAGMWAQSEEAVVAAVVTKAQRAASERDAARSALAECQRGLALSEARERKARAEVDAAKGGDLIVGETLAALLWYSASPPAGRAPMWLNTARAWFRDQSASARATWIADAQRMYGQAADRVASSDAKATAAEASLSRATERGERLAEEMRVALAKLREIPFAATQVFATVAYATCVLGEALADDARDAAGGEDGNG